MIFQQLIDPTKTLFDDPIEPQRTTSVPQVQDTRNSSNISPSYRAIEFSYYSFQKCPHYDVLRTSVLNKGDSLGKILWLF